MDVVYLCRAGENEELRYSLRSLKNIAHGRVWMFGSAPAWVTGATIVSTDQSRVKYANTSSALRQVCEHTEVSDDFILMNDDFYIAEELKSIPTLNRGRIPEVLECYREAHPEGSPYIDMMEDTSAVLDDLGIDDPLCYELHVPMVINKAKMLEVFKIRDHNPRLLQSRTLYGNLHGIGGETVADVKLYKAGQRIPLGPFISSDDKTFKRVKPVLDYLFWEPSEYEAESYPVSLEEVVADVRLYDRTEEGGEFLAYAVGDLVPLNEYNRLKGQK